MNFELNKEYKFIVSRIPVYETSDGAKTRKTIKRIKIVAFPLKGEAVIELIGVARLYQGLQLPVRGRLFISSGTPRYMLTDNKKYDVMKVL